MPDTVCKLVATMSHKANRCGHWQPVLGQAPWEQTGMVGVSPIHPLLSATLPTQANLRGWAEWMDGFKLNVV